MTVSETLRPRFRDYLGLEQQAAGRPSAVALGAPGRKPLSYSELWEHLQRTRAALGEAGFREGEVAALALPNGPELITAYLAIAGMGAGAPLNPAFTDDEYRYYLSKLGARILLIADGATSPAAAAAESLGIPVARMHSSAEDPAGVFRLEKPAAESEPADVRSTEAALLLFTSATTALPKLVPLTGEDVCAIAARHKASAQLGMEDGLLSMMPLFHHFALVAGLAQLFAGGTVISTRGYDPERFLAWMEEFQPTWLVSTPPVNRSLLELGRRHGEVFRRSRLRLIRCAATAQTEALALLEEATGASVLAGYGLTETGAVTRSAPNARKLGSVGRSIGLEIAIADQAGKILEAGAEGEVIVRGPGVMAGYVDNPEANEAAFRDGWFRTGDLGHLDSEGFLFLTGRLKEIINRGGEKIVPLEVDDVLARHPAVAEVAVFAMPHETLGEDIAAAVVLREGAAASEVELRRFVASYLAPFKVPRRILFVEALPRTVTGKPQRAALAEQSALRRGHQLRQHGATDAAQGFDTGEKS
jgi:oxalate---CoA ligase